MFKKFSLIALFTVFLFFIFEYLTNFSFFSLAYNTYQPQDLKGAIKVAMYGFSYIFVLINLTLVLFTKKGKVFFLLLIFISLTFLVDATYYQNDISRGFSTGQFVTAMNERAHAVEAIATFIGGFINSIIFLGGIFFVTWLVRKYTSTRFYLIPVLFLPISVFGAYLVVDHTSNRIYNYPSFVKVPLSIFNAYNGHLMNIPFTRRDTVTVKPEKKSSFKNIIVIVDESIRGDFLGINGYQKKTTEYLDSLDNILTLGSISSVSNASAQTNYILRNGLTIKDVPDKNFSTLKKPTIFQYAQKAGFETIFLDSQVNYEGLQNLMSSYDQEHIDHYVTLELKERNNDTLLDRRILKQLTKKLNNSDKSHFVYFVKFGSHFRWQFNYPEDKTYFKPSLSKTESLTYERRQEAINTYQNSIRWGVDGFFKELVNSIDTKDTLIIYTSDHGQNILENDVIITHGLAMNPPSTMATVPLFFYADEIDKVKSRFEKIDTNQYSQFQLFPSLLDLMGYSNKIIGQYGIPFWESSMKERYFHSGSVFGTGYINKYSLPKPPN
jgi:lipid A ethanolaminephosphotransferase